MTSIRSAWPAVVAVVCLGLVQVGPAGTAAQPTASEADSVRSLNVIMSQSTLGELGPCTKCSRRGPGGLARRAAFVESCRDTAAYVVLLDGGDFSLPDDPPDREHDDFMLAELAAMGYSVIGVGELDLRHGVEGLKQLAGAHGLAVVSANIVDRESGRPLFEQARVIDLDGFRVGVTAFLEPALLDEVATDVPEVRVQDPAEVLQRAVDELRQRCDLVVCLGHMHHARLRDFLSGIHGVDVALSSHKPRADNYPRSAGEVVQLFNTGSRGQRIAWSSIEVRAAGPRIVVGKVHKLVFGAPEDAEVKHRVDAFLKAEAAEESLD